MGIEYLAVTGVSTNSCVETTARDAADRGFGTLLVEDGCGAGQQRFHDATLASFSRLFGRVASADEVIQELTAGLKS
jgi:nicotinamidase-related amidase